MGHIKKLSGKLGGVGPGGHRCACCADIPRRQKRRENRALRRALKKDDANRG